jgi:hypothetical protein
MKKVVTVSLGTSQQDFTFHTNFLGHAFEVQRLGADNDMGKAWELMRRQQASADAIGLGEVGDHYHVGQDTRINKETQRLLNVVTRVPATTGATLRRLLQVRAVRHVQNELGHYFNNNLVLFMSGMRNYDMAAALSDYTPNLKFADALAQTGTPAMLTSLMQLELYAKGSDWALSGRPGEMLEAALGNFKRSRIATEVGKAHVIVGTFHELKEVGTFQKPGGKTIITSAVDDTRLAFFKQCKVNLVVDVSPQLFDRVVGTNVIEAMILAALGKPPNRCLTTTCWKSLTSWTSSRACCTPPASSATSAGFAFVIHPLSQEFIKKGLPDPEGHTAVHHGQGGNHGGPHAAHDVLQDGKHHLAHRCRSRRLADQRGRHAQRDAGAQPRVHLPQAAGRCQNGARHGRADHGLGRVHQGGGRCGHHRGTPRTLAGDHRQQLLGLGRAVGRSRRHASHGAWSSDILSTQTRDGQDHGHWCHRLHRLGQRAFAGHGV